MKRVMSVILAIVVVMSMAVPVFATESARMIFFTDEETANRGDTITVGISLSTVDDCRSGGIVISYDTNVFEFAGGKCLVADAVMSDFSGGTGVFAMAEGSTVSGKVFQFSLKIKDDAPVGSYKVSGSASVRDGNGSIPCGVNAATITISCDHDYDTWTPADGSHQRKCTKCGRTESQDHNWDSGTVIKAATCAEEGRHKVACTVCGYEKEAAIPKTNDHKFGAAADAGDGAHKRVCGLCGKEDASAHSWNSGNVTKQANCSQEGVKEYTCTECNAVKTDAIAKNDEHSYASPTAMDDQNHKATCTICGKEQISSHSWNKGKVTKNATCKSAGEKTYTCSGCGMTKTESIAKKNTHTFDHDCDTTCNVCGAVRSTTHQYQEGLAADAQNHWNICTICGAQDHVQPHEFGAVCGTPCVVCGYERAGGHNYGTQWEQDATGHWQVCMDCGEKTEAASHVPGGEATEFTPQSCTVCGFELAPALGHQFGQEWLSDEDNHWHECACGEKAEVSPHSWDEGAEHDDHTMVFSCTECLLEKTEEIPQEPFPWWILLAGIGVLVTFSVVLLKKRKG